MTEPVGHVDGQKTREPLINLVSTHRGSLGHIDGQQTDDENIHENQAPTREPSIPVRTTNPLCPTRNTDHPYPACQLETPTTTITKMPASGSQRTGKPPPPLPLLLTPHPHQVHGQFEHGQNVDSPHAVAPLPPSPLASAHRAKPAGFDPQRSASSMDANDAEAARPERERKARPHEPFNTECTHLPSYHSFCKYTTAPLFPYSPCPLYGLCCVSHINCIRINQCNLFSYLCSLLPFL